jgi:hypothetical protein
MNRTHKKNKIVKHSKKNLRKSNRSKKNQKINSRKNNTKRIKRYNNLGKGKETKHQTSTAKKDFPNYKTPMPIRTKTPSPQKMTEQSVEDYFLNGTPSSLSENQDISEIIDNSGLSQEVQETIIQNINPDEITVEKLQDGIEHLKELNDSPYKEVYDDMSEQRNYSFDDIINWENNNGKPFDIDISTPKPITLDDLEPDIFGNNLNEEEQILLSCLTHINYNELEELLHVCVKDPSLIQMNPIDVVVIIHGLQANEQINMRNYPITMNFVAPESSELTIMGYPSKEYGRRFKSLVDNAFDKKMFVFDKHSPNKNPMCPALFMALDASDPQDVKETMGIFVRLTDRTIFKITDFNCIFEYIKKRHPDLNFKYVTLEYLFEYIQIITRLIKNIITKSHNNTPPPINIYQISCRPYISEKLNTKEIEKIWNALNIIGNPFEIMTDFGRKHFKFRPHMFVSNSPTSISSSSSQAPNDENIDEARHQQYIIENIQRLAEQLAILNSDSSPRKTINRKKRHIFKNIIKYYRKLSFAFAKKELPVPQNASIICSIKEDSDDVKWVDNKVMWIEIEEDVKLDDKKVTRIEIKKNSEKDSDDYSGEWIE